VSERAYWNGVLAGVAAAAVLAQLWLAVELCGYPGMYAQFGGKLPALTRLAISPLWRWAAPLLGTSEVGVLLWRRPASTRLHGLVAGLLVAAVIATWYFAQAPLNALAEKIR
jgi:hypothetical protein